MDGYHATLSLTLAAAANNNIATIQALGAAGPVTLGGALVSGGVATMDSPRQVIITSAGDDSTLTWTITGTARNGKALVATLAGANTGVATCPHQFATVTGITADKATTGNITVGTNAVGSSAPFVVDWINGNPNLSFSIVNTGGAAMQPKLEVAYENLAPYWETEQALPNWQVWDDSAQGHIDGPVTMVRLTNFGGSGTATARVITALRAGRV